MKPAASRVPARLPRWAVAAASVLLALLFVVPSSASPVAGPFGGSSTPAAPHGFGTPVAHAPPRAPAADRSPSVASTSLHPAPSSGPVASGRGTFFVNHPIPQPPLANQTCFFGTCVNVTNEPSINLTSRGFLAVAYTALTNDSPCWNGSAGPFIESAIGFSVSSDLGSTWSAPVFLGNTNCAVEANFTSAWQPSLTSLANGTLALAYIQYNVTVGTEIPSTACYDVSDDRLVVQESYDNGSSWTTPKVLNVTTNPSLGEPCPGFPAQRPWITAFGKTLYVTWMNLSDSYASSAVHLLVSTDGGSTWGAPIDLTTFSSDTYSVAENPTVIVAPSGELFVTYASNHSYQNFCYQGNCQITDAVDVLVAASTNNGTTFSYAVASKQVAFVSWNNFDAPVIPFNDPSPQLAYGAAAHQLYLVFTAGRMGNFCDAYGYCSLHIQPDLYVTNSSDHGATWSPTRLVDPALMNPNDGTNSIVYNSAIAVDASGTVHLEFSVANGSWCAPMVGGLPACGAIQQLYTNSTDQGRSFAPPVLLEGNFTPYASYYTRAQWDGEYATMVAAGSHVWLAWVHVLCSTWNVSTFGCDYAQAAGSAQVTVSEKFAGTGFALTFQESGLVTGTTWSVSVLGNVRSALAPTNLVVSGIPAGENLSWAVSSSSSAYGIRYFANASVSSPASFSASQLVYENYSEQVLVNIASLPVIPTQGAFGNYCGQLYWDNSACSMINYNITPLPGPNWVTPGASFLLNVTPIPQFCAGPGYCYYTELNLSFESWTGSGAGSTNTSSNLTTIVARGPINETANFDLTGWCDVYTYPAYAFDHCYAQNSTIAFHESGLPAGQSWTVTVLGSGNSTTVSSSTPWIYVSGTSTSRIASYYVWSIPSGAGDYWVGEGNPPSPVELPADAIVLVNFVREPAASAEFPLVASASGLPPGTNWSLTLGNLGFGVVTGSTSFSLTGGSYALNSSPVYYANGTALFANSVNVTPLVENSTGQVVSTPATVVVDGPTLAEFLFTPASYVTVTAGSGGSVTNGSQWVQQGRSLHLNATPDPGFSFVGWNGFGPGAVNSTHAAITVIPSGAISEFASFTPIPNPTWTVTVQETGLPNTLAYSVGFGSHAYSGNNSFRVSGLASGNYTVHVGFVYLNSSNLTRFVPTATQSSYGQTAGGALEIVANGYVNVTFAPQYLLTLSSTGNGTINPAAGTFWQSPSATLTVSATPDPHYRFVGWNGSGTGSINSTARTVSLTLGGPVWETGQFLWAPNVAPKTYQLTVTESGLPGTASWVASVGATGAHGSGTGLTIAGLNGSYTVVVPPVYVGTDTRYVANVSGVTANLSVSVVANATVTVSFTEQFLVTVTSGSGGSASASPTAAGWVNAGAAVTLSATPANASEVFANWTGSGTGAYTGALASTTLTVNGPVKETAAFAPVYPVKSTGSATAGEPLAFGLLAVLLVVGLLVGFLVFRRRSAPRARSEAEPQPVEGESPEDGSGGPG